MEMMLEDMMGIRGNELSELELRNGRCVLLQL